ncbi:MAG: SPOR domain-containing protein [Sphingobacteriales bacterium]|nr:SPOR domain-containing protein [Sphingobacteriales bacterium]
MKFVLTFTAVLISLNSIAQENPKAVLKDTTGKNGTDTNYVKVHKDSRVDLLVKKQAQINEETSRAGRRTDKGFRLLIISTSNRDEALTAKTKVYTYFPELKAYLWHQSPYYKVKAGNFKDRKDAEAYQKKLNRYFPKGVFIMNDTIEVKSVKPGEEEISL